MTRSLNRKEFLNMIPVSLAGVSSLNRGKPGEAPLQKKNVIVFVFDAWSAHNVPFLGYRRDTTPNISRLLDHAVVYHNHYSGAPFTTSGTATILTGTLPWTNRALRPLTTPSREFKDKSIFRLFHEQHYHTFAYTHNPFADVILSFFSKDITQYIPRYDLFFSKQWGVNLFPHDSDSALVTQGRILRGEECMSNSLFFGQDLSAWQDRVWNEVRDKYKKWFKRGIPFTYDREYFILETAMDWLIDNVHQMPQPFFGYYHLLPPHGPYSTRKDFMDIFAGEPPLTIKKPDTPASEQYSFSYDELETQRREYDEYIAYADSEFGRLFEKLEEQGVLDTTWLVLTSDHGESFERGIVGHSGFSLYQPVLQVPLIIFEPGRTSRLDIHTPTSAVDLIPTLLDLNGLEDCAWTEGIVVPPYNPGSPPERDIYAQVARKSMLSGPLDPVTVMLLRDRYKLTYFSGYKQMGYQDYYELYDLENDPQEMEDIYDPEDPITKELQSVLLAELGEANKPYL